MNENISNPQSSTMSDILAISFGTTVSLWAVGYISRFPPALVPSSVLFVLMVLCLFTGGFVIGRYTHRNLKDQTIIACIISALNLLILGSVLSGDNPNQIVPSALLWIPGSFAATIVFLSAGAWLGNRFPPPKSSSINWSGMFAGVASFATLLLLVAGGLVTSYDAGLAVVDWPNSFGYNMFLYPLSRMTGGIYYEHAHRLFGSLVGITTIVLAIHLQRTENRTWLRKLGWFAAVLVVIQGILGGLRVTGHFTLATENTNPNIFLAILHGIIGQIFFGIIVAMAVFLSTSWKSGPPAVEKKYTSMDRPLNIFLLVLLLLQLVLGAVLRHIANGLLIHITTAIVVTCVAITCGVRAWGLYEDIPRIKRMGTLLLYLIGLQIILGIGALAVTGMATQTSPTVFAAFVATAHQATGALLLAVTVILLLRIIRFTKEPENQLPQSQQ